MPKAAAWFYDPGFALNLANNRLEFRFFLESLHLVMSVLYERIHAHSCETFVNDKTRILKDFFLHSTSDWINWEIKSHILLFKSSSSFACSQKAFSTLLLVCCFVSVVDWKWKTKKSLEKISISFDFYSFTSPTRVCFVFDHMNSKRRMLGFGVLRSQQRAKISFR